MPTLDFDALMHNFPDRYQVVAVDPPRWTILAVSDRYTETVGRTREQLVGKPLFEAFPPDPHAGPSSQDDLCASFERVVASGEPDEIELRYDLQDGEDGEYKTRWWKVVNAPIFDDDHNVIAVLNRPEDVTELKHLQAAAVGQKDKASRVGAFLLERGGLIALALFLGFASLGAVAWGLAESNRTTKQRVGKLEDAVTANKDQSEQNEVLLRELKTNQDLLRDCSTPGGSCFEAQIAASSVGAALGSISSSVMVMLECTLGQPVELRTPAFLADCRRRGEEHQAAVVQQAKDGKKK